MANKPNTTEQVEVVNPTVTLTPEQLAVVEVEVAKRLKAEFETLAGRMIVFSPEQLKAARAINRSQKRNKQANEFEMLRYQLNKYLYSNYKGLVKEVAKLEARRYDANMRDGFTMAGVERDAYIKKQLRDANDALSAIKSQLKSDEDDDTESYLD